MGLHVARVHGVSVGVDAGSDHVRPLIHVGEEKRGADAGLRVEARAAIAVPASADLKVEWAVHSVLLRPEYRRQVLRHFCLTNEQRYSVSGDWIEKRNMKNKKGKFL